MQDKEMIKSLVKSIRVLEIISSADGCTLSKIHNLTSIPKPTLIRILRTLEYCNVIRKNLIDDQYRSNLIFSHDRFRERIIAQLTSVSGKVLDRLCSELVWPSDLLIRNGTYMEVVETTRKHTPLSVNRNKIGDKVDMLSSAVGRAYISFCSMSERETLINDLKKSSDYGLLWTKNDAWLNSVIEKTIEDGYGIRDVDFHGSHKGEKAKNDGLSAIAVPVFVRGNIAGCINLLWPSRLYTPQEFSKSHLSQLKDASNEITRKVNEILDDPQYFEN